MKRISSLIAVLLSIICISTGCNDEFTIDETKTASIYQWLYKDIERVKSVEEDKSLLKEKEEYMRLFKKFAGFSLPDYFTFPKVTEEHKWNRVNISERFFSIDIHFIVKKSDALEMLDYLRSQDYSSFSEYNCWHAYRYHQAGLTNDPAVIAKARYFVKALDSGGDVYLNFHYNKDNDVFIVKLMSTLERDPQPGTSWPVILHN